MLGDDTVAAFSDQNSKNAGSFPEENFTKAIVAIVVVLGGLWTIWLRPLLENRKPHPSIPMIPKHSHWLFGHLFWLIKQGYLEKQQALVEYADEKGRSCIWMGPLPSISVTTPQDAKELLWKFHSRHNVPVFKHHFERLAGPKNLFMMNGKEWKYYQSALRTALSRLDPFVLQTITKETTRTLTENIKAKIAKSNNATFMEIPSIQSLMKMITMDVFGRSAFSHDFECCSKLELCAFAKAYEFMEKDIIDRCTKRTLMPQNLFYWIPTARNAKFNKYRSLARGELQSILRNRRTSHNEANDIVSKILEAHAKAASSANNGKPINPTLSEDDLIDYLFSILLAGFETVSTALTYSIFLLSQNPEWETRCLEEIRVAKSNKEEFDLPICRGVILEALRIFPVATASNRMLEKDLVFQDGVTIPKGSFVGVSFWLIHRCEKNFPKPMEFRPDRWMPSHDSGASKTACTHDPSIGDSHTNSQKFFAFSGGSRSCPGQHYAMREATVALAWLIKDLKFTIDPGFELEIEWKAIVQGPKGGIPAKASIRSTH